MGKENQDYFKVGGRSGGPAGSLRRFKEQFAQEQARTHRLEQGRLPHERRPAEARPPATIGAASEGAQHGPGEETPSEAEHRPADDPPAQEALPRESGPAREGALPSPTAGEASQESRGATSEGEGAHLHFGERRGKAARRNFPEANESGFGPPASEEMAVGKRPQRGSSVPGRKAPLLLRQAARRYPLPFRLAAGVERLFDKRIRRALDERPLLSLLERRLKRPITRGLDLLRELGESAKDARRAARP